MVKEKQCQFNIIITTIELSMFPVFVLFCRERGRFLKIETFTNNSFGEKCARSSFDH